MNAAEILEHVSRLSFEEKRDLAELLRIEYEDKPLPGQIAELDRRAEVAPKNPGRSTPIETVSAETRKRLLARK